MRFLSPSINRCGIRNAVQIAEIRFSIRTSYLNCSPLADIKKAECSRKTVGFCPNKYTKFQKIPYNASLAKER